MADHVADEQQSAVVPAAPLQRDPPLPPGYTDPLEGVGMLEEPFSDRAATPPAATEAIGAAPDADETPASRA